MSNETPDYRGQRDAFRDHLKIAEERNTKLEDVLRRIVEAWRADDSDEVVDQRLIEEAETLLDLSKGGTLGPGSAPTALTKAPCANPDCEDGNVQIDTCDACDGPIYRSCPTCSGGTKEAGSGAEQGGPCRSSRTTKGATSR